MLLPVVQVSQLLCQEEVFPSNPNYPNCSVYWSSLAAHLQTLSVPPSPPSQPLTASTGEQRGIWGREQMHKRWVLEVGVGKLWWGWNEDDALGRSYSGTCEHPQWRKESLGKALCPICGHFGKKNNPIFLHDKRCLDTRVKNSAQTIGGKIMGILGYFFLFL